MIQLMQFKYIYIIYGVHLAKSKRGEKPSLKSPSPKEEEKKFVAVRHREPIWQWPWTRKREEGSFGGGGGTMPHPVGWEEAKVVLFKSKSNFPNRGFYFNSVILLPLALSGSLSLSLSYLKIFTKKKYGMRQIWFYSEYIYNNIRRQKQVPFPYRL